jgi:hypothetical protein
MSKQELIAMIENAGFEADCLGLIWSMLSG